MQMYKKAILGFLLGSLGLAGCSKSDTGKDLLMNLHAEPATLNPGLVSDTISGAVIGQMFEGLMTIGKNGKTVKGVAKSYSISDDRLIYTFKIRDDAKWSNGDAVTAQDFEYAWKWVLNPKNVAPYAYILYPIKNAKNAYEGRAKADDIGIKVIDSKTLEVTLENPTPYFLELTSFYTYLPINKKIVMDNSDWAKGEGVNFVTNGPFSLSKWKHNDGIALVKNNKYWDAKNVKIDKVNFSIINNSTTEMQMFRNGDLDWAGAPTSSLPPEAFSSLKKSKELITKPVAAIYSITFNVTKKPFDNENIRKAFAFAINRQSIVDNITKGGEMPAMANVPPTMFKESEKGYFKDNNIKKAKELLAKGLKEMGLKSVDQLPKITYSYSNKTSEIDRKIAEALQDMWKKNLGIDVALERFEWKVYIDALRKGEHQVARTSWFGDFNDPINFLDLLEEKNRGNNFAKWESKEFQELLAKSRIETDMSKRMEILRDADQLLVRDMPLSPLYFFTFSWVKNPKLHGVVINPLGALSVRYAYFD